LAAELKATVDVAIKLYGCVATTGLGLTVTVIWLDGGEVGGADVPSSGENPLGSPLRKAEDPPFRVATGLGLSHEDAKG
jgi:hypothetical protein